MPEYNAVLIKNCIDKAKTALNDSEYLLNDGRIAVALNRQYYAVFYMVRALALKENFVTSKHAQMMGWFNKSFIHENKIFPQRMYEIFKNAFINRQEADYELATALDLSIDQVRVFLEDSKYFVETVEKYLKN